MARPKFEFKPIELERDKELETLNALGAEGWMLAAVDGRDCVMQRIVEEPVAFHTPSTLRKVCKEFSHEKLVELALQFIEAESLETEFIFELRASQGTYGMDE